MSTNATRHLRTGLITLAAAISLMASPAAALASGTGSPSALGAVTQSVTAVPATPHCGAGVKDSHVVARYKMRRFGVKNKFRTSRLFCGRADTAHRTGFGYRHLVGHVKQYFGGWGSFNFSIAQAQLSKKITFRSSNKTYTRQTPIDDCIFSQGIIVHWTFFVVTNSSPSATIITAFGKKGSTVKGDCPEAAHGHAYFVP